MTRFILFLFGFVIVSGLALFAQGLQEAHPCDEAAAHPHDTEKWAVGLSDDDLVFMAALKPCVRAVTKYPDTPRFHFQLGRALWVGKRYDDAATAFIRATDHGHKAAYYYLGMAYEHGLLEAEPANLKTAHSFYALAAEGGFSPAEEAVERTKALFMDFISQFAMPGLMEAFHSGNTKGFVSEPLFPLAYVSTINTTINDSDLLSLLDDPKSFLKELDPGLSSEIGVKLSTNQNAVNQTTRMGTGMLLGMLTGMADARRSGASISEEVAAAQRGALSGSGGGYVTIDMIKKNGAKDGWVLAFLFEERPEDFRKIYAGMKNFVRNEIH